MYQENTFGGQFIEQKSAAVIVETVGNGVQVRRHDEVFVDLPPDQGDLGRAVYGAQSLLGQRQFLTIDVPLSIQQLSIQVGPVDDAVINQVEFADSGTDQQLADCRSQSA